MKLEEYSGLNKIHIHFGQVIVVKEDIDEEEWITYECNTIYRKVISTEEPSGNELFMDELYDACDEYFGKVGRMYLAKKSVVDGVTPIWNVSCSRRR